MIPSVKYVHHTVTAPPPSECHNARTVQVQLHFKKMYCSTLAIIIHRHSSFTFRHQPTNINNHKPPVCFYTPTTSTYVILDKDIHLLPAEELHHFIH